MRSRRTPSVASSSTSVAVPGAAWSERSRLAVPRSPGTRPYRANAIASSSVVLPAPVSPCRRKRPSRSSKTTVSWPANAPKAVTRRRCGRTSALPRRVREPDRGERGAEQFAFTAARVAVAHVPDELGGHGQVVPPADSLPVAALVRARPLRLELEREDVREAAAQPFHRVLRPRGVGERHRDEVGLVTVVRARGEQVVEAAGQLGEP